MVSRPDGIYESRWADAVGHDTMEPASGLQSGRAWSGHKPDGKPQSRIEWEWKLIDGVFIPLTIKESTFRAADGQLSREQHDRLRNARSISPSASINSMNEASA